MVTLELDVKAVMGLGENANISKEKFKAYLEQFEKDDIIEYIVSDVYGDSKQDDEELNDEDF